MHACTHSAAYRRDVDGAFGQKRLRVLSVQRMPLEQRASGSEVTVGGVGRALGAWVRQVALRRGWRGHACSESCMQ